MFRNLQPLPGIMIIAAATALAPDSSALAQPDAAGDSQHLLADPVHSTQFVPNLGQWSSEDIHYRLQSHNLDILFRESAISMLVAEPTLGHDGNVNSQSSEASPITVVFPGSNLVKPTGLQPVTTSIHFFNGDNESSWTTDVQPVSELCYRDLYNGIDLHIVSNSHGVLKYEFRCEPNADISNIRIQYSGVSALCRDESGGMRIETPTGAFTDAPPVAWQDSPERPVAAHFVQLDEFTYTITLSPTYNPELPVTIDPDIEWMYYYGGSGQDMALQIDEDSQGNLFVSGNTFSTDFDGRTNTYYGGDYDAFAMKIDPAGNIVWMVYVGGSGDERGRGIAVRPDGGILVSGFTTSTDFAGQTNSYIGGESDTFVATLNGSGILQSMTYYGGSGDDRGRVIVPGPDGFYYITGETSSSDFLGRQNEYKGGDFDAFVLRLAADGEVSWLSYLGGSDSDLGYTVDFDSNKDLLVTGYTWSTDFVGSTNDPHGDLDGFAVKLAADGNLKWMKYLGGSGGEEAWALVVNDRDECLVSGRTNSLDFEGRRNDYQGGASCAFLLNLDGDGNINWMTYLGGTDIDGSRNVLVDDRGNALVIGHTSSPDFIARQNSFFGGTEDAFLLQVNPLGQIQWMTYMGGSAREFGSGILLASDSYLYIAGRSASPDFNERSNDHYGSLDATVIRIRLPDVELTLAATASCPEGGEVDIFWEGATPQDMIALIYSADTGSFVIPDGYACAGTTLGLGSSGLQIAFQGGSGSNGSRILNSSAPPAACGGYLQLLDLSTCRTSNVVPIE